MRPDRAAPHLRPPSGLPQTRRLRRARGKIRPVPPARRPVLLVGGFAILILVGAALLLLPISARAPGTAPLTALFTATSAVCVTGLVVVDTADHWTPFGQAVIAGLMQIGGLGFVIGVATIRLLLGQRPNLRDRLILQETGAITRLSGQQSVILRAVAFTLGCEALGALALWTALAPRYGAGRGLGLAVFHAISAFTNGSFDLFGGFRSLADWRAEPRVLLPIAALIICGGLSGVTVVDLWQACRRGRHGWGRALAPVWRRLSLDSKMVVLGTLALLLAGTALIFVTERANPASLGGLPLGTQFLNAFFHATAARTAGFATWDFAASDQRTLFFLLGLMFVGGAPGSMAGGIKITTAAVLLAAIRSTLRGRPEASIFARRLPARQVGQALAVAALALFLIVNIALAISLVEGGRLDAPFLNLLFEVTSAFGTVGFSTGLAPRLGGAGQALLIAAMFVGRLGPITVALVLTERHRAGQGRHPSESVRIG